MDVVSDSKPSSDLFGISGTPSDLILRSIDGAHFRVLRPFIEFNLEGLSGVFTSHSFAEETIDGLPVVPFSEDSRVLGSLLRLCYAGPPVEFDDILHLLAVEKAASKYCCGPLVERSLQHSVLVSKLISSKPDEVFLLGKRCRWGDVCLAAARNSVLLTTPFHQRRFSEAEVEGSGAFDLSFLMETNQKYRRVATDFAQTVWSSTENKPVPIDYPVIQAFDCDSLASSEPHSRTCRAYRVRLHVKGVDKPVLVQTWWMRYLDEIGKLYEEQPCSESIMNSGLLRSAAKDATDTCPACKQNALHIVTNLHEFLIWYTAKIETLAKELDLALGF